MSKKLYMGFVLTVFVIVPVFSDMNFVTIGDAGFAADTTGYGFVNHEYRIGRTEVTVEQFIAATGAGNGNEGEDWASLGTGAPAAKISWHEAAKFCNWMTTRDVNSGAYTIVGGKVTAVTDHDSAGMDALVQAHGTVYVLPTQDEWYKAAYFTGSGYSLYANGTDTEPINGTDAIYNGSTTWLTGSGTVEQNGTYNLMGNIWEWTETPFSGSFTNEVGAEITQDIAFFGGGYNSLLSNLEATTRSKDIASLNHPTIGMRVVAIPEPGTLSLMGLSTISLFVTRSTRRRKRIGSSVLPGVNAFLCDQFTMEEAAEERMDRTEKTAWIDHLVVAFAEIGLAISSSWKRLDNRFWDKMVVLHESKVAKRTAMKKVLKKRLLDGFDDFLKLIMK